jgi:hypothetical protein
MVRSQTRPITPLHAFRPHDEHWLYDRWLYASLRCYCGIIPASGLRSCHISSNHEFVDSEPYERNSDIGLLSWNLWSKFHHIIDLTRGLCCAAWRNNRASHCDGTGIKGYQVVQILPHSAWLVSHLHPLHGLVVQRVRTGRSCATLKCFRAYSITSSPCYERAV